MLTSDRRGRIATAIALAVSMGCTFCVQFAQADDPRAEALYREGRKAAAASDWAAACRAFAASEALEPAPGTLLNLADCEEHMGKLADAQAHFGAAALLFRPGDTRIPYATDRAKAIESRTGARDSAPGRPEVSSSAPPPPSASAPSALPSASASASASPSPSPSPSPPSRSTPSAPESPQRSSPQKAVALASFGVGAIGLGAGIVGGILTMRAQVTVNRECRPDCPPSGVHAESQGKAASAVSTVGFVVAAAGAAAGIGLWLALPTKPGSGHPGGRGSAITLGASPPSFDVAWTGSF